MSAHGTRPLRWAITGVSGFVAGRHLAAIRATGGEIVAALDPHDAAGILDRYAPGCRFFTAPERFDRHLDKLRRRGDGIDWMAVCAPNHLHDSHARMAMRAGAHALVEKPVCINPENLSALAEMERETQRRTFTVLQLRLNPRLIALRERIQSGALTELDLVGRVSLTYVTPRGPWYASSWKGDEARSGGLLMNLGIHMFDLMLWLFGPAPTAWVETKTPTTVTGVSVHERAGHVAWKLSVDGDQPARRLTIGDEVIDLSDGFTDAHTAVYRETLAGRGFGIEDARPAIELVHRLRSQWATVVDGHGRRVMVSGGIGDAA